MKNAKWRQIKDGIVDKHSVFAENSVYSIHRLTVIKCPKLEAAAMPSSMIRIKIKFTVQSFVRKQKYPNCWNKLQQNTLNYIFVLHRFGRLPCQLKTPW